MKKLIGIVLSALLFVSPSFASASVASDVYVSKLKGNISVLLAEINRVQLDNAGSSLTDLEILAIDPDTSTSTRWQVDYNPATTTSFYAVVATSSATLPTPTDPPAATSSPATTTIQVWNNKSVVSDDTFGGTFSTDGYSHGELNINWQGSLVHTCQWKASNVTGNDGSFYYLPGMGCIATTTALWFNSLSTTIRAWTSANGTLNGWLTLFP